MLLQSWTKTMLGKPGSYFSLPEALRVLHMLSRVVRSTHFFKGFTRKSALVISACKAVLYLSFVHRNKFAMAAAASASWSPKAHLAEDPRELSTLSNYEEASVTHIHLDWVVDFERKVIAGSATLNVRANMAGASKLVLDTDKLAIAKCEVAGVSAEFSLGELKAPFGRALTIPFPAPLAAVGQETQVTVTYSTTQEGDALQFLPPEATFGKVHPTMFSQCQSILARTLLPCQDTPGTRATYSAVVRVPKELSCIMSALPEGEPVIEGALKVFKVAQGVPIASYLIAIAVGNLQRAELGPRTSVICEPEILEAAKQEFLAVESYLAHYEDSVGPNLWGGRYDLFVQSGSAPFGGMENSSCTFVSPTRVTI